MKNYLLFGALALSVLGSCSNDDVVDINKGSGISFVHPWIRLSHPGLPVPLTM